MRATTPGGVCLRELDIEAQMSPACLFERPAPGRQRCQSGALEAGEALARDRDRKLGGLGHDRNDRKVWMCFAQRGFTVANTEYALAPEHLFPWAVEDCLYAARWCGRLTTYAAEYNLPHRGLRPSGRCRESFGDVPPVASGRCADLGLALPPADDLGGEVGGGSGQARSCW